MRPVKGVLPIVNPTSAHPGVGDDPVGLDEDHLSIAKPRDRDAQVCGAARRLLNEYVFNAAPAVFAALAAAQPAPAAPPEILVKVVPGPLASSEPPRIPRELPPAAYKFFGREGERIQLAGRLRNGLNTAVVGDAGLGKTALAAGALAEVVGPDAVNLASSPFPDGLVYLDLYTFRGQIEPAWSTLADQLCGVEFLERRTARERATEACRARRILVIIEGGEEAGGDPGRGTIPELFGVLSPENRWLLLTRLTTQAAAVETVYLREALHPEDAAALLDWLTRTRPLVPEVRKDVLALLEGHPLALNWAGNLLASDEEDPAALAADWQSQALPGLADPVRTGHTLSWLFGRSVRGLDAAVRQALAAAGLLARVPFPLGAIAAALGGTQDGGAGEKRAREALKPLVQRGLLRRAEPDHWQFTHVLGYGFARDEEGSDPELRQRLGGWLRQQLTAALSTGAGADSAAPLENLLQHATALLRADSGQHLWQPLAFELLYRISDRLEEIGRLGLVAGALDAVAGWMARFPKNKAEEPYWLRERSVWSERQGDVLRDQGDLAGALAAYREALALNRRLAEADPSHAGWQRDLSVSHDKVGDVLRAQGDLAGALAAYRESLALRRRLAEADPSNAGWQRDLSVSQEKVGDVLRDQGDLGGALAAYRESLALRRRLASADLSHAGWQRDLSVSQEKVGDVLRDQGDLAGALAAYREALALRRRLAEADPSNAVWQRDLSLSLMRLADLHERSGEPKAALPFAEQGLAIGERLAALDRSNVTWQNDVAFSRALVARLRGRNDLAGQSAAS